MEQYNIFIYKDFSNNEIKIQKLKPFSSKTR